MAAVYQSGGSTRRWSAKVANSRTCQPLSLACWGTKRLVYFVLSLSALHQPFLIARDVYRPARAAHRNHHIRSHWWTSSSPEEEDNWQYLRSSAAAVGERGKGKRKVRLIPDGITCPAPSGHSRSEIGVAVRCLTAWVLSALRGAMGLAWAESSSMG